MDIIEQIKHNFNKGFFDKAMVIEGLPEEFPAWTIKRDAYIGVGVPLEKDIVFSEHFAHARLWTAREVLIDDKAYDLLMLTCDDMELRNEFATICSQFIEPGFNGQNRVQMIADPESWWNKWKSLMGNKAADKEPYAVMGELVALEWLLENKVDARWSGADRSTFDIETNNCSYEVKSTKMRKDYKVTISSIYQMKKAGDTLDLIFCRFEQSDLGKNIEDLVANLVKLGYSKEKLEEGLLKNNLEKGCTARNTRYRLLEMRKYPVNDEFPAITDKSFKNDRMPENIVEITYTVDLAGVPGENLL